MLTDIEIAQSCEMQPIGKIADKLNIPEEMLEPYGRYKAKVDHIGPGTRQRAGGSADQRGAEGDHIYLRRYGIGQLGADRHGQEDEA